MFVSGIVLKSGLSLLVLFQIVCFSKSPKVFRIVLQYFGDLSCEFELERSFKRTVLLFFFGLQIKHTFYSRVTSRVVWFLQCFRILSFNCQGLSNLLALLAVRSNELETSLTYSD